jgi:GNAT superfamily N-acetyltransferase
MARDQNGIRGIVPADVDAIVRIDQELGGRARTAFFARRFQELEADPGSMIAMTLEHGGRPAGFAFAHLQDGEFGGPTPVGLLDAVAVAPALRRHGVATALLRAIEAALVTRGVHELRTQADWTEHGMAAFFSARGFRLAPRVVLERTLDAPVDGDVEAEEVPVRSMAERDLPAIVRLDGKITGRDRTAYLERKAREVLRRSAVRVSLVAEQDGAFAGFLMARADFGEFGRTEPIAVLDTIGVDPAHGRRGVGRALVEQLLRNVAGLRAERVVTEVAWSDLPLLGLFARTGFRHAQRLAFDKAIA